jgi:DNA-binding NarL/FixJ family response regulator
MAGFLIISTENKGRNQLQSAYKITDREFEVIELIITGISSTDVAEKLRISERTVEAHLNNIYKKMNVKNKIEMLNLVFSYGIGYKN